MSSPASTPSSTMEGVTKRQIAPLLARRRENLDRDGQIESDRYEFKQDGDGHKIHRIVIKHEDRGDEVTEHDLTALEGAAPSTTSSMRVLEIESEIAADDPDRIKNPHIPANDDVFRELLERLQSLDLAPAWEVCDGE